MLSYIAINLCVGNYILKDPKGSIKSNSFFIGETIVSSPKALIRAVPALYIVLDSDM